MRLLSLIIKEIKQQLRDRNGLIFTISFPIVLTLVLGFALSNMFTNESGPNRVTALYYTEGSSPLSQSFTERFLPDAKKYNLFLTEEKSVEKAVETVKIGDASCFIHVKDTGIDITMREGMSMSAQIVETMVKGFVKGFNAYTSVAKIKPEAIPVMASIGKDTAPEYLKSLSLQRNKTPRALDYYALTMITLIIMYAAPGGTAVISDERLQKTLSRMFISPVTNAEILVSKISGLTLVTCLQVLIVFLFDKLVLKTEWGDNLLSVAVLLFAQIIMVISTGVGLAYLFKENTTGYAILNTIIPLFVFLGGGYVNLELLGVGGWLETVSWLSPVKWLNKTLLQVIYANDFSNYGTTIFLCLIISAAFLILTAVLSKKEVRA